MSVISTLDERLRTWIGALAAIFLPSEGRAAQASRISIMIT